MANEVSSATTNHGDDEHQASVHVVPLSVLAGVFVALLVPTYITMVEMLEQEYEGVLRVRGTYMVPRLENVIRQAIELGVTMATGADNYYDAQSINRVSLEVWHLAVGLGRGGAEKLLVTVLPHLQERGVRCRVLALKREGPVADELRRAGVPVEALGGAGRKDPRPVWRLVRRLRAGRPDVLHAHLSRAILAGSWAARLSGVPLIAHFHSLAGDRPAWQDLLEARACRGAAACVAVSRAVAGPGSKCARRPGGTPSPPGNDRGDGRPGPRQPVTGKPWDRPWMPACAAASRATGTRGAEQET